MNRLFEAFNFKGYELYLVGGAVRDRLLGVESDDIDFATSAPPEETILILKDAGFKAIPIGILFGTIQTLLDIDDVPRGGNRKVEITTFRCAESYTKGSRHPSVKFGDNIQDDLMRRDFTFNAIAMREDGSIVDPFNGQRDLKDGVINTPQDPQVIFSEDPLRILRAARFTARGLGEVSGQVFSAMRDNKLLVRDLSGERIFEEMTKLLRAKHASKGLNLLKETEIFQVLFPDIHHVSHEMKIPDGIAAMDASDVVRWASIMESTSSWASSVIQSLSVSNTFLHQVHQVIKWQEEIHPWMSEIERRRAVFHLGNNLLNVTTFCALRQAHINDCLFELSNKMPTKLPTGTGNVLMDELGLKGEALGRVMKILTQQLIDGELTLNSNFIEAARKIM